MTGNRGPSPRVADVLLPQSLIVTPSRMISRMVVPSFAARIFISR
jgi:hypothetical protein